MTDPVPQLDLRSDRTIGVTLAADRTIVLRPPTVGEWRQIVMAYQQADEIKKLQADEGLMASLFGADEGMAPYAEAFAEVINLLSDTEVSGDRLPVWCAAAEMFGLIYTHWRIINVYEDGAAPSLEASPPLWNDAGQVDLEQIAKVEPGEGGSSAGGITPT